MKTLFTLVLFVSTSSSAQVANPHVWQDICDYGAHHGCSIVVDCKPVTPVCTPVAPTHIVKKAKKKVVKKVVKVEPKKEEIKKLEDKDPFFVFGPHVALGLGALEPHTEALVGLRGRFPSVHLGAEVFTNFDYGWGVDLLVYPYQGKRLNWNVGIGVQKVGQYYLSAGDLPRTWDLRVGTGLEYKLNRHIWLTGDWRMSVPNPAFMARNAAPIYVNGAQVYGEEGRYVDVPHALGNSMLASHFLVGLLIRN